MWYPATEICDPASGIRYPEASRPASRADILEPPKLLKLMQNHLNVKSGNIFPMHANAYHLTTPLENHFAKTMVFIAFFW
jgi:hypothetical protein